MRAQRRLSGISAPHARRRVTLRVRRVVLPARSVVRLSLLPPMQLGAEQQPAGPCTARVRWHVRARGGEAALAERCEGRGPLGEGQLAPLEEATAPRALADLLLARLLRSLAVEPDHLVELERGSRLVLVRATLGHARAHQLRTLSRVVHLVKLRQECLPLAAVRLWLPSRHPMRAPPIKHLRVLAAQLRAAHRRAERAEHAAEHLGAAKQRRGHLTFELLQS
mmetsp:Transcript_15688/g.30648  ORF Transcript_15688/g.30648 Transcript_15688/m.30648 type:complete len:223 (-) Transcript_15688:349-1017(-)